MRGTEWITVMAMVEMQVLVRMVMEMPPPTPRRRWG
jgi:hypothetical protein